VRSPKDPAVLGNLFRARCPGLEVGNVVTRTQDSSLYSVLFRLRDLFALSLYVCADSVEKRVSSSLWHFCNCVFQGLVCRLGFLFLHLANIHSFLADSSFSIS